MSPLFTLIFPYYCNASPENYSEAAKKAAEAFYIQSGVQHNMEERFKVYQETLINKDLKKTVEIMFPIVNTVITGKVVYEFKF